jgi:hypothetical protein
MTCDDYLAMLETLPIEELNHGEAREHAAICHDCNRVTRVVAERERNMLMAYGDVTPSAFPSDVAMSAISMARRRRLAFLYKAGLGIAALATIGFIGVTRMVPRNHVPMMRERFAMRCLAGGPAERLLRSNIPALRNSRIRVFESDGVVEVEAIPRTMREVRSALDEFNDHCFVAVPAMSAMPAMPPMPAMPAMPPRLPAPATAPVRAAPAERRR